MCSFMLKPLELQIDCHYMWARINQRNALLSQSATAVLHEVKMPLITQCPEERLSHRPLQVTHWPTSWVLPQQCHVHRPPSPGLQSPVPYTNHWLQTPKPVLPTDLKSSWADVPSRCYSGSVGSRSPHPPVAFQCTSVSGMFSDAHPKAETQK